MTAEGIAVPWGITMLLNRLGTYDDRGSVLGKEHQIPGCNLCSCPIAADGLSHVSQQRHRYCQVLPLSGGSILVEKVVSGLKAVSAHNSCDRTGVVGLLGFISWF